MCMDKLSRYLKMRDIPCNQMAANIEKRVDALEERNRRVELDKAWETSLTRKLLIAAFTYIVMLSFFLAAGLPRPFVNSIVPSGAYLLSTLSLTFFRKLWQKSRWS
jgi:hypothetical protein